SKYIGSRLGPRRAISRNEPNAGQIDVTEAPPCDLPKRTERGPTPLSLEPAEQVPETDRTSAATRRRGGWTRRPRRDRAWLGGIRREPSHRPRVDLGGGRQRALGSNRCPGPRRQVPRAATRGVRVPCRKPFPIRPPRHT